MASEILKRRVRMLFDTQRSQARDATFRLENNDMYKNYFHIKVKPGVVDVPLFMMDKFANYVYQQRSNLRIINNVKEPFLESSFIYSMPVMDPRNYGNLVCKTGASIVSNFFIYNLKSFRPFRLANGELYYTGFGMLLDSNMEIMMMTSITMDITNDGHIINEKKNIYINPKVFIGKDLVSKTILTTIVPIIVECNLNVNILVENKTPMLEHPIAPKTYSIDKELNTMLSKNINLVLKGFI